MREYLAKNKKTEIFTPCSFRLTNVGFSINNTNFDKKTKRTRKDYYLFYVDNGKVVVANDDGEYTVVEKGEFYIYFPSSPQNFWHEGSLNTKKTWISFMGSEIDELVASLGLKEGKISVAETSNAVLILHKILKEFIFKKPHYETMAKSMLLTLLTTLSRDSVSIKLSTDKKAHGVMSTVIELINENPHISNSEIAEKINISADHFVRIFREFFKITPHQYKLNVLMENAKNYLTYSTLTVNQIAELLGYNNDGLYFNASFKKCTGLSPTEYKEKFGVYNTFK